MTRHGRTAAVIELEAAPCTVLALPLDFETKRCSICLNDVWLSVMAIAMPVVLGRAEEVDLGAVGAASPAGGLPFTAIVLNRPRASVFA
jgi:hypothetical protein